MRKLLLLMFVAVAAVTSCEKEIPPIPAEIIFADGVITTPTFTSAEGVATITFNSAKAWTAEVEAEKTWCIISPASGEAGAEIVVTITATENESFDNRTAKVTITSEDVKEEITVMQTQTDSFSFEGAPTAPVAATENTFVITTAENTGTPTVGTLPEWITVATAPAAKGLTETILTFTVKANITDDSREAKITITSGGKGEKFTVTQNALPLTTTQFDKDKGIQGKINRANSYILPLEDAAHKLSIERIDDYWANTDTDLYAGNDATKTIASNADMKIEVVWSDFEYTDIVTLYVNAANKSMIVVTKNLPTKGGNMVVAVTKANGTDILWSWHLWFSDIAVNEVTGVASTATALPSGQKIMDRNLGAKSVSGSGTETYGLLYQWGRKDGFPGSATSEGEEPIIYTPADIDGAQLILNTSLDGSIALAIQNPFIFYISKPGINDWAITGPGSYKEGSTRWNITANSGKGTKTIYDPCPRGWRMPWDGNFSGLVRDDMAAFPWQKISETTASGCTYGNNANAFFPATGFRHVTAGKLMLNGRYGYVWSGAGVVHSGALQHGYLMTFAYSYVSPGANDHRGYGNSVRPVQE